MAVARTNRAIDVCGRNIYCESISPSKPDVKCLGSARNSDVSMLHRTVTVGHEGDEPYLLFNGRININAQTSNERKRQKRLADGSIVLSDDDNDGNFPSFIVIESADGQPIKY
jgi:hypothetical protein